MRVRISSAATTGRAVTLAYTGHRASDNFVRSTALAKASRASDMSGEWNAPLTGSGNTRFAPRSLSTGAALSDRPTLPEITICPGELRIGDHHRPFRRLAYLANHLFVKAMTAAIVPLAYGIRAIHEPGAFRNKVESGFEIKTHPAHTMHRIRRGCVRPPLKVPRLAREACRQSPPPR